MFVHYATRKVGDVEMFYREAGPQDAPVILLLHGFPTASHMFRDLIPLLADRYRVVAPDLPGFGNTVAPGRAAFAYTFDHLAEVLEGFVNAMGLTRYSLYIFDYGAPTGLRLAMRHPERVSAIITQNGNAYIEGLSSEWEPWQAYWRDPSPGEPRGLPRIAVGHGHPRPVRTRCPCRPRLARWNDPRHALHAPARGAGDPAGSDPELPHECSALSRVPGLLSGAQTAVAGCLGTQGSLLHSARCRGLPA